jgi:hypothetical protein
MIVGGGGGHLLLFITLSLSLSLSLCPFKHYLYIIPFFNFIFYNTTKMMLNGLVSSMMEGHYFIIVAA